MADQFLKPQSPIRDQEDYILPITSFDQIIMPDGISRWDGVSGSEAKVTVNGIMPDDHQNIELGAQDLGAVYVERDGTEEPGLPALYDADTLGGVPASQYALKTDIPEIPEPIDPTVYWENIQNKPEAFAPDEHNHDWESIQNKPNTLVNIIVEEWEFTLEDGSVVTKKVLTNA